MSDDRPAVGTVALPEVLCPVCGVSVTHATGRGLPVPGDFTVHIDCSTILRFTSDLGLREARPVDFQDLDLTTRLRLMAAASSTRWYRRQGRRTQ